MADSASGVVVPSAPAEGVKIYDSNESTDRKADTIRIAVRIGVALIYVKGLHESNIPAARYQTGEEALFSLGGRSLEEVWVKGEGGDVTIDYNIVATRFV